MSLSFDTDTITRLRAPRIDDPYGDEVWDWDNAATLDIAGCRLQPVDALKYLIDREAIITRWSLRAPAAADIVATDRIRHASVVYSIEGSVQHWRSPTGALNHIELILRKADG